MKYPSTLLAQKAEPEDIQKADLDLLAKINEVAGTTSTPSATTAAKGHLFGLTLSNNATDPTNDVDIAAGEAVDNADGTLMVGAASTKRLDAVWVVGSGNGGLFSGSIANTTYHFFVIMRTDTGVVDYGFSTSVTAADIPAGYTKYRRIGYIIRSGGVILAFVQRGDRFAWKAMVNDRPSAAPPNTNRQTQTLTMPANTVAIIEVVVYAASVAANGWVRPTSYTDAAASPTNRTFVIVPVGASAGPGEMEVEVDSSSQIAFRLDSTGTQIQIETAGYIDTRGRM